MLTLSQRHGTPEDLESPETSSLLRNEKDVQAHSASSSLLPATQDPSASPAVSPTLAALQTLTSFIPIPSLPWSSSRLNFGTSSAAALCIVPSSSSGSNILDAGSPPPTSPPASTQPFARSRGINFTSRESQLAKLRLRLQQERSQHHEHHRLFASGDYQHGVLDI